MAKSLPVTDTLSKMQDLSVNLNEILNKLVDQHRFKKIAREKLKKIRTKSVAHRSSSFGFRLIQERKEPFFPASFGYKQTVMPKQFY